jgi:hypothetical protein
MPSSSRSHQALDQVERAPAGEQHADLRAPWRCDPSLLVSMWCHCSTWCSRMPSTNRVEDRDQAEGE